MTRLLRRELDLACLRPAEVAVSGGAGAALRPVEVILESQLGLVEEAQRLIAGKSLEALTQPDNDGGWGVVDILSHLLDWQVITGERIQRLLHEEHPHLETFDDSLWAVEHNYRDNDPHRVLEELRHLREAMVEGLRQLPPEAWERTGTMERLGEISLQSLLNRACDHDAKHLQQARDVLA